jgi:hypothetical protein
MEADWEVEIGGDAPVIEAQWAGYVDLGLHPELVDQLEEARAFPPLGCALLALNQGSSQVWTSKCDYWPRLEPGSWDADEMDAARDEAAYAAGCYIDLLPRDDSRWRLLSLAEQDCRTWCARLADVRLHCCRVDLMVRRAWLPGERMETGITAYLTACGATETSASDRLAECLRTLAEALGAK